VRARARIIRCVVLRTIGETLLLALSVALLWFVLAFLHAEIALR
jgi:hypothetical protein